MAKLLFALLLVAGLACLIFPAIVIANLHLSDGANYWVRIAGGIGTLLGAFLLWSARD